MKCNCPSPARMRRARAATPEGRKINSERNAAYRAKRRAADPNA